MTTAFTSDSLALGRILVVANASGAPRPRLFGINIPVATEKKRGDPAFSVARVSAVRAWVQGGRSRRLTAPARCPRAAHCAARRRLPEKKGVV